MWGCRQGDKEGATGSGELGLSAALGRRGRGRARAHLLRQAVHDVRDDVVRQLAARRRVGDDDDVAALERRRADLAGAGRVQGWARGGGGLSPPEPRAGRQRPLRSGPSPTAGRRRTCVRIVLEVVSPSQPSTVKMRPTPASLRRGEHRGAGRGEGVVATTARAPSRVRPSRGAPCRARAAPAPRAARAHRRLSSSVATRTGVSAASTMTGKSPRSTGSSGSALTISDLRGGGGWGEGAEGKEGATR
jgi:hypothetical protein